MEMSPTGIHKMQHRCCVLSEGEYKTEFGFCLCDYTQLMFVREGESQGLLFALLWMEELGYSNVIFELDSESVWLIASTFNTSTVEVSEFGSIYSCLLSFQLLEWCL